MNKKRKFLQTKYFLFFILLILFSCGKKSTEKITDTITSGKIKISVDESFQPIIEKEIVVFEDKYIDAEIFPIYTNEVNAINLLLKDSVRLAITTRKLSENEKNTLERNKLVAREVKLATDGIAIIINKNNEDSLITVAQLRQIMSGEVTKWNQIYHSSSSDDKIQLVFDNANSSTVRYAIDSICKGKSLSKNLYAQGKNNDVIEYVSKTPNAIGIIGVSWLGNKADTTRLSFLNNVKLMSVSSEAVATVDNSYKPYQAYLALNQYPLVRDVYVITTDPKIGLPMGFLSFISSDIGQRIILKEGIVPATQAVRVVDVRENF